MEIDRTCRRFLRLGTLVTHADVASLSGNGVYGVGGCLGVLTVHSEVALIPQWSVELLQ